VRDKIDCTAEWFINKLITKLYYEHEVKGKGDWKDVPLPHLLRRLCEEVGELAEALLDKAKPHQIVSECVDVAAIAMMIADNEEK
jgi:NTP pyrophosphatase (non-canonical NTP hydrolase)